jgi:hypothetical protein
MSRTVHNSKGPGYDYWSRRNYKTCTVPSGRLGRVSNKVVTRRAERRIAKQRIEV